MKEKIIRAAAAAPKLRVADTKQNAREITSLMRRAAEEGAEIVVFPALCVTGATCGDLFMQRALRIAAKESLADIINETAELDITAVIGAPEEDGDALYNAAFVIRRGKLLHTARKTELSARERRWFSVPESPSGSFELDGVRCAVTFGAQTRDTDAQLVLSPDASPAYAGSADAMREKICRRNAGRAVIFANAGEGESTTDGVFTGQKLIISGGVQAEARLESELLCADIALPNAPSRTEKTDAPKAETILKNPWLPEKTELWGKYLDEMMLLQCLGLKKRAEHTGIKKFIVGISGGLDSTLAVLISCRTLSMLGLPARNLVAVTMPCFGTTERTKSNAEKMAERLGAELRIIDIGDSVKRHFEDIGHDFSDHGAAFENAQARERTQVLMDMANDLGALVIGTGDMSELALGWATYNGDHMSMYGVNAGVPKTLCRAAVRRYADTCGDDELKAILYDVIETPVSPELLPTDNGRLVQKTEDTVGPYELHDFFMWHFLDGDAPEDIYKNAVGVFEDEYDAETVKKWLSTFIRRFFTQQFKRSCLPDGPQVLEKSLSPRGGLSMPSDAVSRLWLERI